MGDIILGAAFVVLFAVAGFAVGVGVESALGNGDVDADTLRDSSLIIVVAAGFQQGAMAAWPVLVSRWKGRSIAADWGWRFRPVDIGIGIAAAVAALYASAAIGASLAFTLDVDMADIEGNTDFLTDGDPSGWFIVALVLIAVVGAPVSEELFFRGLSLRTVEKRFGVAAGVVVSSVLFTLVHFTGGSASQSAILFAGIGARGVVFAGAVLATGRLAPAIIAHALSNLLVVGVVLAM